MGRFAISTVASFGLALLALATPAGALADASTQDATTQAGNTQQAAAQPVSGGVGFRVEQTPDSQLVDGFIPINGSPGQTVAAHFIATNTQPIGAAMSVYPADGLTATTTGVVYGDAGDALTGAGAWVTPDRSSLTLGGRSEQRVDFTVRIPAGASAGDHVAGVVLEQSRPGSAKTGTISQVVRVVVPIMIEVPGAAAPQVRVKSAAITALPGSSSLAVTVTMRNDGLKLCRPTLKIALGSSGNTGGQVIRPLDVILPGDTAPYPMPWPSKLSSGSYLVHVVAAGCGDSDTLDVTVQTPKSQEENSPNTNNSGSGNKVVTNATPGAETYTPGGHKHASHASSDASKKPDDGSGNSIAGVSGSAAIGAVGASGRNGGGPGGSGGANAGGGSGAGAGGKKGGILPALSDAVSAVAKHAPAIAERATIPLSFLLLVGLIFFAQEAFDRRDPKLALAPLHREQDLPFDPDPMGGGFLIPSPTDLSPGTS